jgi:hypothetical protein
MNAKIQADFRQAIDLLRDDKLIWSEDMDAIRKELADVLDEAIITETDGLGTLNHLAEVLIRDENDLTAY